MTSTNVPEQAQAFIDDLTALFAAVLPYDVPVFVPEIEDESGSRLQIGPKLDPTQAVNAHVFSHIPLRDQREEPGHECLSLRVIFTVDIDDSGQHLRVLKSTIGLWLDAAPGGSGRKARPVFRVEYERHQRKGPPAHIHFHAESSELAWLYGRAGRHMISMSEIHFPIGGKRFRPTVEDVLRFLHDEGIYRNWATGWQEHLDASQERWHQMQTGAAARRYPEAAARALREQGYDVVAPADEEGRDD